MKAFIPIVLAAALAVGVASVDAVDRPDGFALLAVTEGFTPIDSVGGSAEEKVGTRLMWRLGLYEWAGRTRGARVGRAVALCTLVGRRPEELYCTVGFFVPGGQILGAAFVRYEDGSAPTAIPVVGGTGAYGNARGFVRARGIGPESAGKAVLEFHLAP